MNLLTAADFAVVLAAVFGFLVAAAAAVAAPALPASTTSMTIVGGDHSEPACQQGGRWRAVEVCVDEGKIKMTVVRVFYDVGRFYDVGSIDSCD